jgi:hypothetical protein
MHACPEAVRDRRCNQDRDDQGASPNSVVSGAQFVLSAHHPLAELLETARVSLLVPSVVLLLPQ